MTALLGTGTSGTILTLLYFFYKTFVGKKCRSRCCNQDIEMGMAVEDMSPKTFEVRNPIHVETK